VKYLEHNTAHKSLYQLMCLLGHCATKCNIYITVRQFGSSVLTLVEPVTEIANILLSKSLFLGAEI